ncbi:MAG TPA: protein kinase [Anaerolineae bacterium]|nr:protein kinase [Anaerolineae bacterium]HQK15160.1 protein kinase [Anaerolineae bacterium]
MKPTILNQRYRLVELVGAGGMATVYRGEDLLLERKVAVKFLREPFASDPDFRQRFLGEARAAARLDHPNIVRIYDVGEDEGNHPYIVMEIVEGEDLKTTIRRDGPLPVNRALNLARQICAGVGHAHRAGIVHCDLKPQNILVTYDGQVKVTDFGIARAFQDEEHPKQEEAEDVVWGSPHYIAPEQAMGKMPTPATDVYSIGVTLYEMLTGVPPFHDPDPAALAMKHIREEPVALRSLNPRVPPGLEMLVLKALAKEPGQRYLNADQFGAVISAYMQQAEEYTRPQSVVAPAAPDLTLTPPPATIVAPPEAAESDTQPVVVPAGPDYKLWALIAFAALAVMGLVPLWIFVYRAYTRPVALPVAGTMSPTVTTPANAQLVSVPNLTGLSAPDAQRLAEGLGLRFEVLGEKESTDARPGAILEQTPAAGSRVAANTPVQVIVAAGRAILLQDVVGFNINDPNINVQAGLESQGLLVYIEKTWSLEPEGVILRQAPDPNTEVRAGSTVTLTVSGGANFPIPMQVNLNNQVILQDARVSQRSYRPGDTIAVTLRWEVLQPFNKSYKVFIHVLTRDFSTLLTQRDIEPLNGLRPTTTWTAGEIINDPHQVPIPQNAPAGIYQIRVGLYDAEGRLPVVDAGQTQVVDDTIFITEIEIRP